MKGWLVYGAYFILIAGISGMLTAYLRTNAPPHIHSHAAADDFSDDRAGPGDEKPVAVTIQRANGTVERLQFPGNAGVFSVGNQT